MLATWRPPEVPCEGRLTNEQRESLPDSAFAFPLERKEPLCSAGHVELAMNRFLFADGVNEDERDLAWANILAAASYYGITLHNLDWHTLMHGQPPERSMDRWMIA